ncbi:MAG: hypothetical protein E7354_01690 [Clostridiales bacterium]|nr:hypothetical protein [Clostridiales bacterium]
MKKTLVIITSLFLICIILLGCGEANASITTSKELNKNLTILSNTVKRLDTVDNAYLINEDLYSLNDANANKVAQKTNNYGNITKLANSNAVEIIDNDIESVANKTSITEDLKTALSNEIIERLYCDENGNCRLCKDTFTCDDNGVCNNCNQTIICDDNGNCKECKTSICLDSSNSCSNCGTNCITTSDEICPSSNIKPRLIQISNNNKEIIATPLSNTIEAKTTEPDTSTLPVTEEKTTVLSNENTNNNHALQDNNNNETQEIENEKIKQTNIDTTENFTQTENSNNTQEENNNSNNTIRIIYYTEENFAPEIIRYNPRHIASFNYKNATSSLENYINKIQKLYTMTADVVEANNSLSSKKDIILEAITEAKKLNNCIIEGSCTPNENQVDALNNYINEMKTTINNIRNCNGMLTNEINKISSTNNGLSQGIDVISSNYLKILNQLDTRISYHENAIATLEQIKYILEESISQESTQPNNNEIISDPTINTDNTSTEDTTPADIEDTQNIENNHVENNDTTVNEDNIINTPNYTEETSNNNELIEENNNTSENTNPDANNTIDTQPNTISDNNENIIVENNTNTQETNIETQQPEEILTTKTSDTNIDTYKEPTFGTNNIDSMNNNKVSYEANNTDENINNADIINNNNALNNSNILKENNILYNGNNGYENNIINENNIGENELGNYSYRYDNNGHLYNNTNGFNTNAPFNQNTNSNNVNTYKYNTMIDSINRGTVNNGINTL